MIEVAGETLIDLPINKCWEKMRDYSLPHNYIPDVLDTKIIGDQKEGVGAHRKVYLPKEPDGIDETIIDWQDGAGFTLRLHKGDKPAIPIFKEFQFTYAIEKTGSNQTLFKPVIKVTPKFGFRLLTNLFIKKSFVKTLKVIGQSMKEFYETGQPTSPERIKEIRASV